MKIILLGLMVLGCFSNFAEARPNSQKLNKNCSLSINLRNYGEYATIFTSDVESDARKKGYSEIKFTTIPEAFRIGFDLDAWDKTLNRELPKADLNIDLIDVAPAWGQYAPYYVRKNKEEAKFKNCKQAYRNKFNDAGQLVFQTEKNETECEMEMAKSVKKLIPKCTDL